MSVNQASATNDSRELAPSVRRTLSSRKAKAWIKSGFAFVAIFADLCAIAFGGLAANILTQIYKHGEIDLAEPIDEFGALVGAVFLAISFARGEYSYERYLSFKTHFQRCGLAWSLAFPGAVMIAFMMKTTPDMSRAWVCFFFVLGFTALMLARYAQVLKTSASAERGGLAARRVLLLGYEHQIEEFYQRYDLAAFGMRIVTATVLRGRDHLDEDLVLAAAAARIFLPEDVFILLPWTDKDAIDRCINAFLRIPAALHLGSDCLLDRFTKAKVANVGPLSSLNLTLPWSPAHVVGKRLFDIVAALAALTVLSPVFVALALAIKLDSKGPAIFRQRRYGFNQEPFRIFKFRSMRTLEDDRRVRQATAQDPRVTRIGRFMRKTNLDELPQLLNVLLGDMSLVGPRPHALAHDQLYEPSVTLYARRHNVKPGITGWAQVNGLRGEITPETLKARIEHDLYYIDHWSLWLDLQILWRTLMSAKAFKNAY
ncbi:exopolysaccharide biosynthesis polyprenyl glycosylphosphotransferase [Methylocapsa polymorpha]|uniref:Exopolysaccharide biosynthesis polyprenyl glycosylphosphotransferase n=1 Tax=Methylocapsa polymorpha TaxID=3080828 RepID=A0ABZ0HNX2_9HYPH|nr:exopolysaccharide biosynthesis polyprenyl glycosylphosphotransferase [Methylocapsa sp. RX1]